jgi:CBS domain-containing protein
MRLIVDFGRIYAIKSNLVETNTLRRLQAIYRQDRMNEALGDIMHAYEFLMYQRLKHQSQSMRENGGQPNNFIRPADLTTLDQQTLKEAFRQIRIAQAKLKMDFFLFFP